MDRRTIKLGRPLKGISILPSAKSTPAEVLLPIIPTADPVEVVALRSLLAGLGPVIEKLRTQELAAIDTAAQATVELAVALAERLLSAEIAADHQRLDRIVRDALERMQPAKAITVRGHPDDLALLQRQIAEHGEAATARTEFTYRPEKSSERGQLKVEADEWFVDFDTQRSLAELRDRLLEETFANE